jgi:DNA replication protein DnaC
MKNQTESLEHASVRQYCKAVRVPAIGANFVSLAEQAVKENQTHIRYLEALLQVESEERDRHAIANRTRDAQLPRMKTLEEFDLRRRRRFRRPGSANWLKAVTSNEVNR